MTYLFFDIECANSFGGIGKICSFGYVLCGHDSNSPHPQDFTVLETDDILMHPGVQFDWYLFKKGSKCQLTHTKSEYQKQPKFPEFYEKIRELLGAEDRLVFGFGCKNDVATITTECLRYNLPQIDFSCHDMHPLAEKQYDMQGGLGTFVEKLGIETEGMEFHDSRADAWFTMKLTERLAKDAGKTLEDMLTGSTPYESKTVLQEQVKKLYKKWLGRTEAKKTADGKPPRTPKKLKVPDWFDFRKELLFQIQRN